MSRSAFFAYPASEHISSTVAEAVHETAPVSVTPWPHLNTYGYRLDNLIREKIDNCDFLLADITIPNFNVYYEIGYCIGTGKPVVPTADFSLKTSKENVDLTGLFATTGQLRYLNFRDLASKIKKIELSEWRPIVPKPKNYNQPLFFLGALSLKPPRHISTPPKCEELRVSKSPPLYPVKRTSAGRAASSPIGQQADIADLA